VLALVPVIAGMARFGDLATATPAPDTARFHAHPLPVAVNVLFATLFAFVGTFSFTPTLRRIRWHRRAGSSVVPMSLAAALSGLCMTLTYP
jgi:hypothetical protein